VDRKTPFDLNIKGKDLFHLERSLVYDKTLVWQIWVFVEEALTLKLF
jgi:hypothetical protein